MSRWSPASKSLSFGPGNTFATSPPHIDWAQRGQEGSLMRYQAQSFVKQVQVDLLALPDVDLCHTIEQWGPGQAPSGLAHDALEVPGRH